MVGGHVFDFGSWREVTYSKTSKGKGHDLEEPGFPYIFVQRIVDFGTDEPEKVGRFSESDPEDVVSTRFLGDFWSWIGVDPPEGPLGQWLNFKLFGITYLVEKIKFELLI